MAPQPLVNESVSENALQSGYAQNLESTTLTIPSFLCFLLKRVIPTANNACNCAKGCRMQSSGVNLLDFGYYFCAPVVLQGRAYPLDCDELDQQPSRSSNHNGQQSVSIWLSQPSGLFNSVQMRLVQDELYYLAVHNCQDVKDRVLFFSFLLPKWFPGLSLIRFEINFLNRYVHRRMERERTGNFYALALCFSPSIMCLAFRTVCFNVIAFCLRHFMPLLFRRRGKSFVLVLRYMSKSYSPSLFLVSFQPSPPSLLLFQK